MFQLRLRLAHAQPQREPLAEQRVRQVDLARPVQGLEQRPVLVVAGPVPETDQVQRRGGGEFEIGRIGDPPGELLGQRNVSSHVMLKAARLRSGG